MKDRRRFKRATLSLGGRFLDEQSEEHAFLTLDLSCAGAHLIAKHRPPTGSNVVCYIDHFARVSGRVVRHTSEGFVVTYDVPAYKRDKLADRLVWLLNRDPLQLEEDRVAERFPTSGPCTLLRNDGTPIRCRALDISLTGASFETDGPPPFIGDMVTAGALRGEVVRRERRVFAIRFLRQEAAGHTELRALAERASLRLAGKASM